MPPRKRFDVFLSHNSLEKAVAIRLKELLVSRGLRAWIDIDELRPGMAWQPALEAGIQISKSVAVIIGSQGMGSWQSEEVQHALSLAARDNLPVIGVLIPGAPELHEEGLPWAVKNRTIVDMRSGLEGANLDRLEWGITGRRPKPQGKPEEKASPVVGVIPKSDPVLLKKVLEHLEHGGPALLEAYAELFSLLSRDPTKSVDFDALLADLESRPQDKRTLSSVSGYAGTGKSTFLLCLAYAQKLRFASGHSKLFPISIDLRDFIDRCDAASEAGSAAANQFASHLDRFIGQHKLPNDAGLLLIIDGCDEYYRHSWQTAVDHSLREKVDELARLGRVVKVIGVGQGEDSFPGSIEADTLKWAEIEPLIELGRVSGNEAACSAFIRAYVRVNEYANPDEMTAKIETLLDELGITELDLFILSLLETAVRRSWHVVERGMGSLYFDYCRERVQGIAGNAAATSEGGRKLFKILAEATFQIYVPESKAFDRVVEEMASRHPEYGHLLVRMVAEIPHLHTSVKEFLIAEHAIELILSSDMPLGPAEGAIYPYATNRFVKSIINRSEATQNEILARVERLIGNAHTRQLIHLTYILGRFKNRHARQRAQKLLYGLLEKFEAIRPDYRNLDKADKSVDSRNWLLLQRTIYISLIYLGDADGAAKYLLEMLEHPICDNLNRGFHLQYYQDLLRPPASHDMIELDDLKVEPTKTFDVLLEKLRADRTERAPRAMSCVELYTLCSLCVNRHVIGRLAPRHRERLYDFIKDARAEDFVFPKEAWPYVEKARELLAKPAVSIGEIFMELHALKEQDRAGWNATHTTGGIDYQRKCPKPESVSDHIWGCMVIAGCFIPDEIPDCPEYAKSRVIQLLLIHDLSETYLGDKPSFTKTDEDRAQEDRCMAKISSLSALDAFKGMLPWRGLWAEWRERKTINAKIASDIDAIESYIQMRRYQSNPACAIPDADIWADEVAEKLSEHGRKIFNSLRHPRAGLLSWH